MKKKIDSRIQTLLENGFKTNQRSMTLNTRQQLWNDQGNPAMWPYSHGKPPPRPTEEGDDLSILFSFLLNIMDRRGFFKQKKNEGKSTMPAPDRFLSRHWVAFVKHLESPWLKMGTVQKANHLHSWLLKKLSLDPKGKFMYPKGGGKRLSRNEMGWVGLEMTDDQLSDLVYSVMEAYAERVF